MKREKEGAEIWVGGYAPLTKGNDEDGIPAFATCGPATFHLSRICLPGCGTAFGCHTTG